MNDTLLLAIYFSLQGKKKPADEKEPFRLKRSEVKGLFITFLVLVFLTIGFFYLATAAREWNFWLHLLLHIPLGFCVLSAVGCISVFILGIFK
ncbi:hypothetical protein EIZ47_08105 [Chryseobacterium lacus]|uniref:Uncharacterized protein n=1 Tax=Chryseobacterium lacus TaxID=2058346 RepID=A0A368N0K2_9FLAO|nr:hypothetical protein [Chryseobacterium lacus]RCU42779.1 hypothetical protein DQ356_08190 [Chryseobacterium lacus]RST27344.1 hypothetical protein EIZ47_08105 [Chryseobacterium lacus]